MQLDVNGDMTLEAPSESTIVSVIAELQPDQFVILSRANEQYVQAYLSDDGTFDLEYRAGSFTEHYAASGRSIFAKDVQDAFVAFLSGRQDWNAPWDWEVVEFDEDFKGDLTSENAYLLNGEEYAKVPVGSEVTPMSNGSGKCSACQAAAGEFHVPGCELESCPRCHELLQQCDCE